MIDFPRRIFVSAPATPAYPEDSETKRGGRRKGRTQSGCRELQGGPRRMENRGPRKGERENLPQQGISGNFGKRVRLYTGSPVESADAHLVTALRLKLKAIFP